MKAHVRQSLRGQREARAGLRGVEVRPCFLLLLPGRCIIVGNIPHPPIVLQVVSPGTWPGESQVSQGNRIPE